MSTEKRNGPRLTIEASCMGCAYEHSEGYCIDDGNDVDSGHTVSCIHSAAYPAGHPDGGKARQIGDTTWKTPAWCPLLASATAALLGSTAVPS